MGLNRSDCRMVSWSLVLLLCVSGWFTQVQALQVQPSPKQAETSEPATQDNSSEKGTAVSDTLGMLVVKSGWFSVLFYVLLFVFSMVALMVSLERMRNLPRHKIIPTEFVADLRALLRRSEIDPEEIQELSNSSDSPIARILKGGVLRIGRPLPEVEKAMEDAAAREMAELRSRNRPLSVVGNIAPLVGLLGTVVGMIFAFSTASEVGLGRADELAKGIYLALITTAGGLTIAIPSLLAATWFNGKVERYMREIDENLLETMPCFARFENQKIAERDSGGQFVDSGAHTLESVSGAN